MSTDLSRPSHSTEEIGHFTLPKNWKWMRLKGIAQVIMGQSPESADYSDDTSQTPFLQGNADFGKRTPEARVYSDAATKHCCTGDVLVSVRAPVGAVNVADKEYGIGRGLCALRSNAGTDPAFLYWAAQFAVPQLQRVATGSTYEAVSVAQVGSAQVPTPPEQLQGEIGTFLNDETARVDSLIAEQERLITLLQEKRQAVISHAVTKGLDPQVPMKNSGVDWIGLIPTTWTASRFLRYVDVAEGQVDPAAPEHSASPLIAPNHIESGTGRLIGLESAEAQGAESGKYVVREGDVVYSKIRPALRKLCIAPTDGLCSADMYPLRPRSSLLPTFLLWWMLSEPFSAFVVLESHRVAMPKINRDSLKEAPLVVPPIGEQRAIASHLADVTGRIDDLTESAQLAVRLLKERRTALITAAVTGQIDVRGLAEAA